MANLWHKRMLGWAIGACLALAALAAGLWWWRGYVNVADLGAYGAAADQAAGRLSDAPELAVGSATSTVAAVVAALPDAAIFRELLADEGSAAHLGAQRRYTVFVPTDDAFNALPHGAFASMTQEEKRRLLNYHIVPGRALDLMATSTGSVKTLSADRLSYSADPSVPAAKVGAAWAVREIKAKNGIVYVVSAVLVPLSGGR